jgi:hypothetical protein
VATLSTPPQLQRQISAPAPLRLWHLTSLDAPTVAFVWTLAFAWAIHIRLPLWLPAVVSLSAWACYIADRLMDARKARRSHSSELYESTSLRERHRFHWRNRRILLPVAVFAVCAASVLVLRFMPLHAQERDSALAIAAFAYFGSVHSSRRPRRALLPKELLVALVFTLACAAPAFTRTSADHAMLLVPIAVFIALAWLNCHAIETWESSFLHAATGIRRLGYSLAALLVLAAVAELAVMHAPRIAALLLMASVSAALLGLLDQFREHLTPLALRAAADLVLLTPLALLPFA